MLETMADALALARGVLEQNLQLAESQTFARHLQTQRANLQRILFGTTARAAGMHHEIIDPKGNRALDFFAERVDRFQQDDFIGSGEIDEVISVNQNGR